MRKIIIDFSLDEVLSYIINEKGLIIKLIYEPIYEPDRQESWKNHYVIGSVEMSPEAVNRYLSETFTTELKPGNLLVTFSNRGPSVPIGKIASVEDYVEEV